MKPSEQFLIDLISQGEGQIVEFKTRLLNELSISKALTAFANSNGGILIIGVSDNGEILGLADEEAIQTKHRLEKICKSIFPYPAKVEMIKLQGKNVVYAQIDVAPKHLAPITTGTGELYLRREDRNVAVKLETRMFSAESFEVKKAREIVGFVAMSFRNEEEPALIDYFNAMLRAADKTELPIKLIRMDFEEGDFEISQELMNKIEGSDFVIADYTLSSHNVYFEAGYARALKKRMIQTAKKETNLQFDVRNWKTVFYRNATELEMHLIAELKAAYKDLTVPPEK